MPAVLMLLDFVPDQQRTFEEFLLRVARTLRAEGWQLILAVAGEPGPAFADALKQEGGDYRIVSFPLRRDALEPVAASLAGSAPLVLVNAFVSCFDPCVLWLKKRLGIRYWIAYDHSSGAVSAKSGLRLIAAKFRSWYVGRHVDRVLAVSEFIARRDVEHAFLPASRVKVLLNGVDLDRFQPAPAGEPAGEPKIVFVGQLIPEKGVRTLLKAMALLKQRPTPLTPVLEMAGRGVLADELQATATGNGLDNVRLLGQVADMPALYRSATVVVIPSEWAEAFGLVVAEAMACGACVLVSDAGGIPEVVGRDEEGGRIFRNGDAADLAEKLAALLADPEARAKLRTQARARAERLFSLDGMVNGFVRELLDVARKG